MVEEPRSRWVAKWQTRRDRRLRQGPPRWTPCALAAKMTAQESSEENDLLALVGVASSISHARRIVLAGLTVSLLAACAGAPPPPPPKPTIIQASVEAGAAVNPDNKGRASPIVVRVYELRSLAAFNGADFFSLWDREKELLAADMVAKDEFQLRPGEQKKFERNAQPDTKFVAVIAAFRDIERANWRGSVGIAPNQTTPVAIKLDARSVGITGK